MNVIIDGNVPHPLLQPLIPAIVAAVDSAVPGSYVIVKPYP